MMGAVKVVKVPKCGYVPIGNRTYHVGQEVNLLPGDEDDVKNLLADGYVEWITRPDKDAG